MIEKLLKEGMGTRAIGRVLKRGHSSISEEIKKNKMRYDEYYDAGIAQGRSIK